MCEALGAKVKKEIGVDRVCSQTPRYFDWGDRPEAKSRRCSNTSLVTVLE